jgi:hypothetical protein
VPLSPASGRYRPFIHIPRNIKRLSLVHATNRAIPPTPWGFPRLTKTNYFYIISILHNSVCLAHGLQCLWATEVLVVAKVGQWF